MREIKKVYPFLLKEPIFSEEKRLQSGSWMCRQTYVPLSAYAILFLVTRIYVYGTVLPFYRTYKTKYRI